jgi:hypothetical protein
MDLILCDMRMLSLISTATLGNSKAVIEHEIIGNNFVDLVIWIDKTPIA